jgi:Fe-S-cluster containining protein
VFLESEITGSIGPGDWLPVTMPMERAIVKTFDGKDITVVEQTPIPCFRCGICCTRYQPPLTEEDIDTIASCLAMSGSAFLAEYALKAPIKEGYLLKTTGKGCVFLVREAEGRAGCAIHPCRPKACREWTPSLAKPECQEGLARLKSKGQILLPDELFSDRQEQLCISLERNYSESQPDQRLEPPPHGSTGPSSVS